jgi:uncharacterized membrane protein YgcG
VAEHTPNLPDQARQLARGELVQAEVEPLDLNGTSTVAVCTAAWAVAFGVMALFFRDDLADWWLWVPVTGFGLGLLGLVYCKRRWNAILRERQPTDSTSASTSTDSANSTSTGSTSTGSTSTGSTS